MVRNRHRERSDMKHKRLTQRDIIQKDDEYKTNWGRWEQIEPEYAGKRKGAVFGWYTKMRRLKGENHETKT